MSSNPSLWVPLRQGNVSDLIARRILDVISSDRLKPGDQLPEREFAAMLGTSRPSLREALQSLRARGYLEIRHGAGVFVADPASGPRPHPRGENGRAVQPTTDARCR